MMNLNDLMDEPTGVNIIDASQLIIATLTVNFEPNDVGEDMLRHMIIDTIRNNIKRHKAQYPEAIVAFDDAKNGYWRRDVAWYYKKNRTKAREESKWDWEEIFKMINKIVGELIFVYPGATLIKIDRTEADDIIAVLTKRFSLEGRPVLITSSDSDFTQLHKFKLVKQWSPGQKKWVKTKNGSPLADLMYKIVKGDKKDGVAGIKCRPDFVVNKIEGERAPPCSTKWIEQLIDADDPRVLLSESERERYDENVKLLDFEAIPEFVQNNVNEAYNTFKKNPRGKLYTYFVQNRLVELLKRINDF